MRRPEGPQAPTRPRSGRWGAHGGCAASVAHPEASSAARGYHQMGTKALARTLGRITPPDLREQFYRRRRLPPSYSRSAVSQAYLQLKSRASAAEEGEGAFARLHEKTGETLLFLFQTQNMFSETVDLCKNWSKLVTPSSDSAAKEIPGYYLAEAVLELQLPAASSYYQAVSKALGDTEHDFERAAEKQPDSESGLGTVRDSC